jgi:hypothetical protein
VRFSGIAPLAALALREESEPMQRDTEGIVYVLDIWKEAPRRTRQ